MGGVVSRKPSPRRVVVAVLLALLAFAGLLTFLAPVGLVAFTLGMAAAHSPPAWCDGPRPTAVDEPVPFRELSPEVAVDVALVRDLCGRGARDGSERLEMRGPDVVDPILARLRAVDDTEVEAYLLERLEALRRAGHLATLDKPTVLARIEAALHPDAATRGPAAVELSRLRAGAWGKESPDDD